MYSFLGIFGASDNKHLGETLTHSSKICCDCIPTIEGPLRSDVMLFSEVNGGFGLITPKRPICRPSLHVHDGDRIAVLLLGYITGTNRPAELIAELYENNGIADIKKSNGSFGVVIIDKLKKKVVLVSDPMGHQAFRWIQKDKQLFVSSHDLPLVASGAIHATIDSASLLSILVAEWSLGGVPLLKGATLADTQGWLEWEGGAVRKHISSTWCENPKINKRDVKSIRRCIDDTVECLRTDVKNIAQSFDNITISLTSGYDSRLVLALIPNTELDKVAAETSGGQNSTDSVWARRLSRVVGIPHHEAVADCTQTIEFSRHLELLAFALNGDVNGCWAFSPLSAVPDGEVRLTGVGCEIFRGYHYKYAKSENGRVPTNEQIAKRMWRTISNKGKLLPVSSEWGLLRQTLLERITNIFQSYSKISDNIYDQLDFFYALERFGRWGALSSRRSWYSIHTPTLCQDAFRHYLNLPQEIRRLGPIHVAATWRYLPKMAFFMPVNGWAPIIMSENTRTVQLLRGMHKKAIKTQRKVASKLGYSSLDSSEYLRSNLMLAKVMDLIRETLLSRQSLMAQFLSIQDLEKLIGDFISTKSPQMMQTIGFMMTTEYWYRQLKKAEYSACSA